MRIGYVSYVNPFVWAGGGELVSRALIEAAARSGHDVSLFALWPQPHVPELSSVDGWVVVDLHSLPDRQARPDQRLLGRIPPSAAWRFRRVMERARREAYVHLDNAYVDICNHPYLPCQRSDEMEPCPLGSGGSCFAEATREIYDRARVCFFVSPMHAETVCQLQPAAAGKVQILRPVLDPLPFLHARRDRRDIECLYVGAVTGAKGANALREIEGLVIVSPHAPKVPVPKAEVIVGVPYSEMPEWFGRSRRFVFRAEWPEPFGRVVAEASLAGCELDVQGRVGALSFDRDLADPLLYEGAAEEFWDAVGAALG